MPFSSKKQQRYMFWAESKGKIPKGTAEEWAHHTKSIKNLPEKVGSIKALLDLGLDKFADDLASQTGTETRLKRNHEPSNFFNTNRSFERAAKKKKEIGTHVSQTDKDS